MDRYRRSGAPDATAAPGFTLSVLAGPSRLYGANGILFGPDGRLFIAQNYGSQVSALDVATGSVEDVLAKGGPVLAVDDLAFDDHGTLYLTETMRGRVAAVTPHGAV